MMNGKKFANYKHRKKSTKKNDQNKRNNVINEEENKDKKTVKTKKKPFSRKMMSLSFSSTLVVGHVSVAKCFFILISSSSFSFSSSSSSSSSYISLINVLEQKREDSIQVGSPRAFNRLCFSQHRIGKG